MHRQETSIILLILLMHYRFHSSPLLVPWTCKTCVTYIFSDQNRFFFHVHPKETQKIREEWKKIRHIVQLLLFAIRFKFILIIFHFSGDGFFHFSVLAAVFRHKFSACTSWMGRGKNMSDCVCTVYGVSVTPPFRIGALMCHVIQAFTNFVFPFELLNWRSKQEKKKVVIELSIARSF